ncbi:MAG: PRC-barrel domain-containing protein [Bacillota bacterium]|nr:PRC-barrel domain-containing protein [Bacillota bacterium]
MNEQQLNGTDDKAAARDEKASRKIIAMPLYSVKEGLPLGQVKSLLLDPKQKRVLGFLVEKRRFSKDERILPFSAVNSFGEDMISVERAGALERRGASPQYIRACRNPVNLIGARVFTAGGKTLGRVEEYRFDTASGAISALEIAADGLFADKLLARACHIIAIAPHTVMLDDAVESDAERADKPLQNAADNMQAAADKLKSSAADIGKKLSESISGTVSKLKKDDASALAANEQADEAAAETPNEAAAAAAKAAETPDEADGGGETLAANEDENEPEARHPYYGA